jgi:hypothetical protein
MGKEALRQCADKRLWSQLRRWLALYVREGVSLRRAGSEAGEKECYKPVYAGVLRDIGCAEVVGRAYFADARPVLAQQRAMPRALVDMAGWPTTHPGGGGDNNAGRPDRPEPEKISQSLAFVAGSPSTSSNW